jgi:2-iminobutanoate/2-iminopropanoate deaminase
LYRQRRYARPDGTDIPEPRRCLKAAGATWADIVKTNTLVTDFEEFHKCGDVRSRYFRVATSTSTTVGVIGLAGPDFMIEIKAVAVVNS